MRLRDASMILVEFGQGLQPLLDLVDAWAGRVLKLLSDTDPAVNPNDAATWTIHDLVGALYLRDAVERGVRELSESQRNTGPGIAAVTAVDELFKSFTVFDKRGVIRLVDPGAPNESWWWHRLPATGPVASEADTIANLLGGRPLTAAAGCCGADLPQKTD
jgi:hypothetical protein